MVKFANFHGKRCILINCPFCGDDDIVIRKKIYDGQCEEILGHVYYYVECLPCDCRTGFHFDGEQGIYSGIERAMISWNMRYVMEKTTFSTKKVYVENIDELAKKLEKMDNVKTIISINPSIPDITTTLQCYQIYYEYYI